MKIFAEIAACWAALDVVLLVAWHTAHVHFRSARTRSVPTRPATLPTPSSAPQLALVNAG